MNYGRVIALVIIFGVLAFGVATRLEQQTPVLAFFIERQSIFIVAVILLYIALLKRREKQDKNVRKSRRDDT